MELFNGDALSCSGDNNEWGNGPSLVDKASKWKPTNLSNGVVSMYSCGRSQVYLHHYSEIMSFLDAVS